MNSFTVAAGCEAMERAVEASSVSAPDLRWLECGREAGQGELPASSDASDKSMQRQNTRPQALRDASRMQRPNPPEIAAVEERLHKLPSSNTAAPLALRLDVVSGPAMELTYITDEGTLQVFLCTASW
jgi:hypothetical protein